MSSTGRRADGPHSRLTALVKRQQENGLNMLEKVAWKRSSEFCLRDTRALPLY